MGRPFVSQVVSYRGLWIAAGGASDGYAAVWTSRDGEHWRQTLASHGSGSAALVSGPHHTLLAYVHNDIWSTTDGSAWGAPTHWQLPGHMYLGSVADGGRIALGFDDRHENAPTPLLRATRGDRFVETQVSPANTAKTSAWTVQRVRGLWVVEGWKGQPNQRPAAWVSRDLTHWESLPARLAGTPGGVLSLVASVGDRIVLLGTAPELDRFYTLSP
jgi:hypothetical protein